MPRFTTLCGQNRIEVNKLYCHLWLRFIEFSNFTTKTTTPAKLSLKVTSHMVTSRLCRTVHQNSFTDLPKITNLTVCQNKEFTVLHLTNADSYQHHEYCADCSCTAVNYTLTSIITSCLQISHVHDCLVCSH